MPLKPKDIVDKFQADSEENAKRCRDIVKRKIESILSLSGITENLHDRVEHIYQRARNKLANTIHISINLRPNRFLKMVKGNILPVDKQENQYDQLFRDNIESIWVADKSLRPVYGALNWECVKGGAPMFGGDLWLELKRYVMESGTTFSARDSYNIVLPFLSNFDKILAENKLRAETYCWDGILDQCLERFWIIQDLRGAEYIEAQIWRPVRLEDVEAVHIRESHCPRLIAEIRKIPITTKCQNNILAIFKTFT